MPAATRPRTLGPAARLRLLRRAVAVLHEALAAPDLSPAAHSATLEHVANALGERGLAATSTSLDELEHELDILGQLEAGVEVCRFMDVDRFYGTRDEAREWLVNRLERNVRGLERRIAGA